MAATRLVRDLITRAARIATVIGGAEPLDANDASDILLSLNQMLDSWQAERLYAYNIIERSTPLIAGQDTYLIGPAQALAITVRPMRLEYAFTRDAQGYDRPMEIITHLEYADLFLKTLAGAYPTMVHFDPQWPNGRVRIWPLTNPSIPLTLYVGVWVILSEYTALGDLVSLPPGYEDAITYSLAERICIEFEKAVSSGLEKMASMARARVKRMNVPASRTSCEFQGTQYVGNRTPWWVIQGGGP